MRLSDHKITFLDRTIASPLLSFLSSVVHSNGWDIFCMPFYFLQICNNQADDTHIRPILYTPTALLSSLNDACNKAQSCEARRASLARFLAFQLRSYS